MLQGNLTPDRSAAQKERRELDLQATPAQVVEALKHLAGLTWLDHSCAGSGAWSVIAVEPTSVLTGNIDRDWHLVTDELRQHTGASCSDGPGPGLYGWVGYDGDFVFGHYESVLAFDHDGERWFDIGGLASHLPGVMPDPDEGAASLDFQALTSKADFMEAVRRVQDYILAGDVYQVNLAYQWLALWPIGADALALYHRLRCVSPAPYAAYLDLSGTRVLSSSPECFLKMEGDKITTRPIKGTRPRFPDDEKRDETSAHELINSPKERAELLMITDLERNDLGMVCEFGTVRVPELAAVERFAQVFHLVATVTGRLRPELDHASAFRSAFPGGSITGAPKKRAREIIAELEPLPRGIYTGAIGYFGFNQRSEFNIAIRTAIQRDGEIRFHVGSGIVADSLPCLEWEETLHKAGGLLRMAATSGE